MTEIYWRRQTKDYCTDIFVWNQFESTSDRIILHYKLSTQIAVKLVKCKILDNVVWLKTQKTLAAFTHSNRTNNIINIIPNSYKNGCCAICAAHVLYAYILYFTTLKFKCIIIVMRVIQKLKHQMYTTE